MFCELCESCGSQPLCGAHGAHTTSMDAVTLSSCRGFGPATVVPGNFEFTPLKDREKKDKKKKSEKESEFETKLPKRISIKDFSLTYSTRIGGLNESQAAFFLDHFKTEFVA